MLHFVYTFLIMRVYGVKLIGIEKILIMEKLYSSKTSLKMAGGEDVSPLDPLMLALIGADLLFKTWGGFVQAQAK